MSNEFTSHDWDTLNHEERVAILAQFQFSCVHEKFGDLPYVVQRTLTYHARNLVSVK